MQDDVMLAFLMNGEKLPKEHGFPLRLLVPGLYGIKNVNGSSRSKPTPAIITVIGNAKDGPMTGRSRFFPASIHPVTIRHCAALNSDFRGIAFGGPNSISKVEISFDAAKTWDSCELETPMSPYSWVVWNYTWRPPKRSKFQVAVRAIDTKGQLQIAELIRPQPAGAAGLHTIIADVESVG